MIDRERLGRTGNGTTSLSQRLAALLANDIRDGRIGTDQPLPSIRGLARACDISPDTVVRAYERLTDQGLVRATRGAGFFATSRFGADVESRKVVHPLVIPPLADWRTLLRTDMDIMRRPGTGVIAWNDLGDRSVDHTLKAVARTREVLLHDHADPRGYLPLRSEIQRKLAAEGIACEASDIFTAAGATGAINLIVRTLVRAGNVVLMEEPGPFIHKALLLSQGALPEVVPRLGAGPDLEALRTLCERHRPRLFFLSSLVQNPTGTSIAPHVAHEMLRIADEFDLTYIDDAAFADLWTPGSGGAAMPLALLDRRRVIHVGSFSATLSPRLRVGFVVANAASVDWLAVFHPIQGLGNPVLDERVVYHTLAENRYHRRLTRLTRHLATCRAALSARLYAAGLPPAGPGAGPYIWQPLGDGIDTTGVGKAMLEQGYLMAPGVHFGDADVTRMHMRLNVTTTSDDAIRLLAGLLPTA